jgi:hypothetical protein
VWGSALLVFSGLLELIGGRHGIDHVVDGFDIPAALGSLVTGVVALVLALTSRPEHGFRRGVLAGVGLAALLAELGFLVVSPSFFFHGGLVDELSTAVGGALIVLGVARPRPAPAPRPSGTTLGAAIGGFVLAAIPLLSLSWLPGTFTSISAFVGIYAGLAVGEVLALAVGGRLRPGLTVGIGLTTVVIYAPLVGGVDAVPAYGVVAAVVGGLLVVGAGFLDRAAAAGMPTSAPPSPPTRVHATGIEAGPTPERGHGSGITSGLAIAGCLLLVGAPLWELASLKLLGVVSPSARIVPVIARAELALAIVALGSIVLGWVPAVRRGAGQPLFWGLACGIGLVAFLLELGLELGIRVWGTDPLGGEVAAEMVTMAGGGLVVAAVLIRSRQWPRPVRRRPLRAAAAAAVVGVGLALTATVLIEGSIRYASSVSSFTVVVLVAITLAEALAMAWPSRGRGGASIGVGCSVLALLCWYIPAFTHVFEFSGIATLAGALSGLAFVASGVLELELALRGRPAPGRAALPQ